MDDHPFKWNMIYLGLAAAAGSIVALYSMEWKRMHPGEIGFTLLVGFLVAIFAVPYLAELVGLTMTNPRTACGVTFIGGTAWNVLMPLAINKAKRMAGVEEKQP